MSASSNDDTQPSAIPNWIVYAGVGVASWVAYQTLFRDGRFTHQHKYIEQKSNDFFADYPDNTKYYATNPWDEVKIYRSKKGAAARKPQTIFQMFKKCVDHAPNAIYWKKEYLKANSTTEYEWKEWTRLEVYNTVKQTARSFIACGLKPWEAVSIIGFNSPEWLFSDLGCIFAGGIVAGIYTTNKEESCRHIASHSKSSIVVVENKKQLKKFLHLRKVLKLLKVIVIWDIDEHDPIIAESNKDINMAKVIHWNEFMSLGSNKDTKDELDKEMNDRISKIKPGQCSTLIYTSGTTGLAKGVMISHDNICYQSRIILEHVKTVKKDGSPHASISYLPLSHIAAQLLDIFLPMGFCADYPNCKSWIMYFARPTALKGTLGLTLKTARPTVFFGVPRVWEKIQEKVVAKAKASPPGAPKKMLIDWLKSIVLRSFYSQQVDGDMVRPFGYSIAEKLLIAKVRSAIGFDRLQCSFTGAAPTPTAVLEFWGGLGINIIEVYGMSESSGVHTVSLPYYNKIGTVGVPLPGVQTLIDHVDEKDKGDRHDKPGQGEICMRGRHIMMGYMYDEIKTKKAIDNNGYLHSGDIGTIIDKYNILKITGRLKELLITHGGENVAPVPIEDYIKQICPAISNLMVIGDKRKYLTCLLTLTVKQDADTGKFTNELDGASLDIDDQCTTVDDAKKSNKWKEYLQGGIDKYNNNKDVCVSNAQTIKYYRIVDGDFGVESGELTSTMKLKRTTVSDKHKELVQSMYMMRIKK